jgi:RluA family pseudouridine synthase
VLFEDEYLIGIDKPPSLSVIPERNSREWPFMGMLLDHARGCPICSEGRVRFRVVHRLDKDTTGVMVVAKTLETARRLGELFAVGAVRKKYLAIVAGEPTEDSGLVDAPLATLSGGRILVRVSDRGKASQTRWRVVERFRGFSLIEAEPLSGRTHQVRVHLAYAGMGLAVDRRYSRAGELKLSEIKRGYKRKGRERPLIERLTLHCAELTFEHPAGLGEITISAPPAPDFVRTLKALRKWAPGGDS